MISNTEFKSIAELDLDPIKVKLMHKESGEGWTLEYSNKIEFEYRRFLYLMKTRSHEQVAPHFDVDIFWHYHILDTMKYAVDCETVFGYFLHHFPYVGLRGAEDEVAHQRIGARMKEVYEETFGEPYLALLMLGTGPSDTSSAAWSSATNGAAWSSATTKAAWSSATTKAAWSSATTKAAWSSATTRAAWSSATTKAAWSSATTKAAWSSATNPAKRGGEVGLAAAVGNVVSPDFYSTRPMLAAG